MDTVTKFTIKRRTSRDTWDCKELVTSIKLTSDMDFQAGELNFDLAEVNDDFGVRNGDVVEFNWDHMPIFRGYVFNIDLNAGKSYSVTAYDSLRYFKSSDSLIFPVQTIEQRFNAICGFLEVKHKAIANSGYKLAGEVEQNKSYFGMLQDAIKSVRKHTGERYFLHDNLGTVELRKYPYYQLKMVIGDESLVTDYTLTRSIENLANVVRVSQTDTVKGKQKVATEKAENDKSIEKYGKLVHVEQSTKKLNSGQMRDLAKKVLNQTNHQQEKLKITTIGNVYLQAGNSVTVSIRDLKDVGVKSKRYLIKNATHHFGSDYHVELELKV
jgi:hypothetical protein